MKPTSPNDLTLSSRRPAALPVGPHRNRYDAATGTLAVSKIFDWYRKDFEQGHKGITSLQGALRAPRRQVAQTPQAQADVQAGRYRLSFLDYDWALNDAR